MAAHDHDHAAHDLSHSAPGRLKVALVGTIAIAMLELAGGIRAGSLGLLSDSAHVAMDAVALGIALMASLHARRPANIRQTFGFARLEILAALANAALLFGVTIAIIIEAVRRFFLPVEPAGQIMVFVATIGLFANLAIGTMLFKGASHNLNFRAAIVHIVGDVLGALAVVIGGALILWTHLAWIDPLLSLIVSAIILSGVVGIVRDAGHVLLESAPDQAAIPKVRDRILAFDGVVDVHDLHVWTIGSGSHALAAHVVLNDRRLSEASAILHEIDTAVREDFGVDHVTVQFECDTCAPGSTIVCTQVTAR